MQEIRQSRCSGAPCRTTPRPSVPNAHPGNAPQAADSGKVKSSAPPGTLISVHPPTRLDDSGRGRWRVTTQTSRHLIDLTARTVTRIDGAGVPTAAAGFRVSALRRDCETLPLLELVRCEAGYPMTLLVRVRDDCVTGRRTTAVVAITPAEERTPRT